jgi:hypothetical protein
MPVPRRRRLVDLAPLAAALAAALVALGCVSAPNSQAGQSGEPDRPASATRTTPAGDDPDGTDTPAEFKADVGDAERVAEAYWRKEFKESGLRFEPVAQLIAYEREGEVSCGGQGLGLNNAAYCSAGDFIAYDIELGVRRVPADRRRVHLLPARPRVRARDPARLGIQKEFTIEQELQADCMAGAYIGDTERGGTLQARRRRPRRARQGPRGGRRRPGPALVRGGIARLGQAADPGLREGLTTTRWTPAACVVPASWSHPAPPGPRAGQNGGTLHDRPRRPTLNAHNRPRCSSTWTARWSTARRCGTSRCTSWPSGPAARSRAGAAGDDRQQHGRSMRILREDLGQPDRTRPPTSSG